MDRHHDLHCNSRGRRDGATTNLRPGSAGAAMRHTAVMAGARVLVVDDDLAVRAALTGFIDRQDGYAVVGQAENGAQGVEEFTRLRPDLVMMDLQMPVLDGIGAISAIRELDRVAKIVALTTFDGRDHVVAALRAGASGYLLKDTSAADLVIALGQALVGDMPLSPAIRHALVTAVVEERPKPVTGDNPLTARQSELVGWLAQGLTNAQIGRRMYLSEGSVKQYLQQIGERLGVSSRTQILIRGVQLGIVDPDKAMADEQ